jgi:hypothetical protein
MVNVKESQHLFGDIMGSFNGVPAYSNNGTQANDF